MTNIRYVTLGLEKCIFHAMDSQTNWKIFHFRFHFHFHLEKYIFHAMDSQTNWKIWAVVETKLPETLSLFFFPSFHNLYFRTQHHLIKIYLNEMLIKTFPLFLNKWKLSLWSILIEAGSLVICCDTNQRSFLFWVAIKRSTYWKLIHNKIFTLTA